MPQTTEAGDLVSRLLNTRGWRSEIQSLGLDPATLREYTDAQSVEGATPRTIWQMPEPRIFVSVPPPDRGSASCSTAHPTAERVRYTPPPSTRQDVGSGTSASNGVTRRREAPASRTHFATFRVQAVRPHGWDESQANKVTHLLSRAQSDGKLSALTSSLAELGKDRAVAIQHTSNLHNTSRADKTTLKQWWVFAHPDKIRTLLDREDNPRTELGSATWGDESPHSEDAWGGWGRPDSHAMFSQAPATHVEAPAPNAPSPMETPRHTLALMLRTHQGTCNSEALESELPPDRWAS